MHPAAYLYRLYSTDQSLLASYPRRIHRPLIPLEGFTALSFRWKDAPPFHPARRMHRPFIPLNDATLIRPPSHGPTNAQR